MEMKTEETGSLNFSDMERILKGWYERCDIHGHKSPVEERNYCYACDRHLCYEVSSPVLKQYRQFKSNLHLAWTPEETSWMNEEEEKDIQKQKDRDFARGLIKIMQIHERAMRRKEKSVLKKGACVDE